MTSSQQSIDTIGASHPAIEVSVSRPAFRLDPITHYATSGLLEVSWRTTDHTIELLSLTGYLDSWAGVEITAEDLVAQIWLDLEAIGVEPVEVVWHGTAAGMPISVWKGKERSSLERPRTWVEED